MPRTYITAADGTLYEAIPARTALRRKIIRRTIAGIAILITALFLSAAIIGLQRAAIEGSPRTAHTAASHRLPNREELKELAIARHAQPGASCRLEWDGPAYPGYEAICTPKKKAPQGLSLAAGKKACKIAKKGRQWAACINLYFRTDWHDDRNYTPAGKVLVPDCISQYRGIELTWCFEQEIG